MSSCICRRAGNWFVWCHLAALDLESMDMLNCCDEAEMLVIEISPTMPFLSISMIFYVFAGEHQVILEVVSWCPRLYSPMSAITPLHGTNGRPGRPSLRNLGPQRLSLCCLHIFELLRGCTRGTKKQLNLETSSELLMDACKWMGHEPTKLWCVMNLLSFLDLIQGLSLRPPIFNHSCTLHTPAKHTAKGKPPRKSQECHVTAEEHLTWSWILWTSLNSETARRKDGIQRCASPNWASNTAGGGTSGWMQMGGNGSEIKPLNIASHARHSRQAKRWVAVRGSAWQCVAVRNAQRLQVLVPFCPSCSGCNKII